MRKHLSAGAVGENTETKVALICRQLHHDTGSGLSRHEELHQGGRGGRERREGEEGGRGRGKRGMRERKD